MNTFFDKCKYQGYLDGVSGDLELRLEALNGNIEIKESKAERIKTLDNHVKAILETRQFIQDLFEYYEQKETESKIQGTRVDK